MVRSQRRGTHETPDRNRTGRATCKTCGQTIAKGELCLVKNTQASLEAMALPFAGTTFCAVRRKHLLC